ncbi:hypothetical protein LXL04_029932 [Taraxacum kok-saghyz]
MESFCSFLDGWSYESLTNFRPISPEVQTFLKQEYALLYLFLIAEAIGVYFHILWNIGGLLTTLAALGCMFWLHYSPPDEELKGVLLIMACNILKGASFSPIINLAIDFDPSIMLTQLTGAAITLACFSIATMLSRRREYIYLGTLVFSSVLIFFWLDVASKIFGGDIALLQFEFYIVLLVFVGWMVVLTQVEIWNEESLEEEEEEEKLKLATNNNVV